MSDGLLGKIAALEKTCDELTELAQAVSRVVGGDEVLAKVAEIKCEKMIAPVAAAVKKGEFKASVKVGPESFVVGVQFKKGGQPIFPGRFQIFVNEMVEDVRAGIVGLAKEKTLSLKDGGFIRIDEIYDKVTPLDKVVGEVSMELDKLLLPKSKKKSRKK